MIEIDGARIGVEQTPGFWAVEARFVDRILQQLRNRQ
jgi:hypothetical protein